MFIVSLTYIRDIEEEELESILAKDPFNKAGVAEYNITEFTPSMVAPGFEILQK